MRSVSRFESNLLRILHAVLGRLPTSQVLPMLTRKHSPPKCLSRNAVDLVKQALAVGCCDLFVRAGGWRQERFVRQRDVVSGRIWERRTPQSLGLSFSANSMRFLIWLTGTNIADERQRWDAPPELTLGDEWLLFLVYQSLRNTDISDRWCKIPPFRDHALCALAFPEDWGHQKVNTKLDFTRWVGEPGAGILESMQWNLADRWVELERAKTQIQSSERMRSIGGFQQRVLDHFLRSADQAGRRDLARFLLVAARRLLSEHASADNWIGSLNVAGLRVADRMETYHASVGMLRQLETLQKWEREARNVAYYDEEYAASQLWKSDWEQYEGESSLARAAAVMRDVEPMA